MENWKYTAFISYRHGGTDEFVARNLHTMLENYRVPGRIAGKIGRKRAGRIFRDVDELPSSSSLYNNIEEALGQSEFLIVICTPRLQESRWCMREIELFKKMRGSDHIIAVLAEGEPQDSFPYELTHRMENGREVEVEPLAADVRGETPGQQKHKMKTEQLRILAALLHCEFDQLRQRDRQRKIHRITAAGGAGLAVVCAFLAQTVHENMVLQKQVRKTQSAQSYLLAEYSDTALKADNPKLAALLAMEGLPEDLGDSRPFEGAAMASLTNALQVYDYQKGYTARGIVQTKTMDAVMVSPYDDYIAYIDLVSSTEYTLHFYDIAQGKTVADFPVDPDYCGYRSCNSKIAFFGDHRCAIAGKDGIQVIDMNTLKVIWEGAKGMTVSASGDGSVVSVFDTEEERLTFYTGDGEKLSERSWDCDDAVYFGMNEDGRYAAITENPDEGEVNPFYVIDTHTGETVKLLEDRKYVNVVFGESSWCGNKIFFVYGERKYGCYDLDEDKVYTSDTKIDTDICYGDDAKGIAFYRDGSDLNCISIKTGEILQTYEAEKNIADVVYTGDGDRTTFAVYEDDGSIEYVDYTEEPYSEGRLEGDGTECSEICAGKDYIAAYVYNNYEFRIYELNDRSAEKSGTVKKRPNEDLVTVNRYKEAMCLNGNTNTYVINTDTLQTSEFDEQVSYMSAVNQNVVSCDNLDGTISFYDAATGEHLTDLPDSVGEYEEPDGAYVVEDGVLKKYSYEKTDKSAEEVEPVYTEKVPEGCTGGYVTASGYLVGYIGEEDSEEGTLFIQDKDRKEVFSKNVTSFRGTPERDYVLYQTEENKEYILYNFVEDKEITALDLGQFDWLDFLCPGYLFLCSSDKGAFIIDDSTGEIILNISEASALYSFEVPEGQPYYTALYLADNGETRLDVYDKDNLSSPVARIKGGLALNKEGEVLIYDGVETVYAVPFLSEEKMYSKGKEVLGGLTLTDAQKVQYHCD